MPASKGRVREIFLQVVGKVAPDRWEERLAAECAGDADLLESVRALLRDHVGAGSFLEKPAAELEGMTPFLAECETNLSLVAGERPGTHIGPYQLVKVLGEGGMGTV